MRTENHRDVRTIMRAIDRAIASHLDAEDGLARTVASSIITIGDCADDFSGATGRRKWSSQAVRAILLAYALHAPDDRLRRMAQQARRELKWVEWWEQPGGGHDQCYEVRGGPDQARAA